MPRSALPPDHDWEAVEQLVRTTNLPLRTLAEQADVPLGPLYRRARLGRWRPSLKALPSASRPRGRPPGSSPVKSAPDARRALIARFYTAIDIKLKQMELRMKAEIKEGKGAQSAADHERDTRAIGGLISQLGKISEYEGDLDRPAGQGDDFAAVAAEAERCRRELAERLARLIPAAG